jgi:hypothetical protein
MPDTSRKFIVKSTPVEDLNVQLPDTDQYRISTGAFIQHLTNPIIKIKSGVSSIGYTSSKRLTSNRCEHVETREFLVGGVGGPFRVDQPDSDVFYQTYGPYNASVTYHSSAVSAAQDALDVSLDSSYLANHAQDIMNDFFVRYQPDLTKVNLPDFLLQIGKIKDLFHLWQKRLSLSKNLAGGFLNYKFGWRPTLGDIQEMVSAVSSFQNTLKEFEELCGRPIRENHIVSNNGQSASGNFSASSYYGTCYWSASLKQKVSAGIIYTPQPLQAMSSTEKTLRGLLDSLGFQLNPRIIWDNLPFTFIIDWFFGVGSWLENFSIDTLHLPIRLVDGYVQYKQVLRIESYVDAYVGYPSTSPLTPKTRCPSMVTERIYFQRVPTFPSDDFFRGLGFRNPTASQWQLLVALATVLL